MRKKTIFAPVLAVFLLVGIIYGCRELSYFRQRTLVGPATEKATIYIEPDNTATRAAAKYLSFAIRQTLGKEAVVVNEKEDKQSYFSIICGTNESKNSEMSLGKMVVDPVYSISMEDNDFVIFIPMRSRCFGVVKAVADRWLQKDCGLKHEGELRISQAMIDRQLSELQTAVSGEIRILTQNLCYSDDGDGKNVEDRAARFIRLIEDYQPDLIGTQECNWKWLQLLQRELSGSYEFFGWSRNGPNTEKGEWNAILYRKDRFTVADGETFWLSNTPNVVASKLNYQGAVRICTWVLLRDTMTGKEFLLSNTHLQNTVENHELYQAIRARQTDTLFWQLRKNNMLTLYPGFLTGDFNGISDEAFYSIVTSWYEDSRTTAIKDSSSVDFSYQNYGNAQYLLDYCFHSPNNVAILDYHILDDQYNGYVSDHYGILVTAIVY